MRLRAALIVLASVALSACSSTVTVSEERVMEVPHVAGSTLRVETRNGRVAASVASRADVLVRSVVTAGGSSHDEARARLDACTVSAVREADGTLAVTAQFPEPMRSGDGARLEVEAPALARVEIATGNGRVALADASGPVRIRTSNGAVEVQRCASDVEVRTSNGRIEATDIGGPVVLESSNGRIVAARVGWPVTIDTSNGSVELVVTHAPRGALEATTSNGSISLVGGHPATRRTEIERRRVLLEFVSDGPRSVIDTSNGSVSIRFEPAPGG